MPEGWGGGTQKLIQTEVAGTVSLPKDRKAENLSQQPLLRNTQGLPLWSTRPRHSTSHITKARVPRVGGFLRLVVSTFSAATNTHLTQTGLGHKEIYYFTKLEFRSRTESLSGWFGSSTIKATLCHSWSLGTFAFMGPFFHKNLYFTNAMV